MQCYDGGVGGTLLLYDDRCHHCTRFALLVHRLYAHIGYRVVLIGLYSVEGVRVKALLYEYCDPDAMFWLIHIDHGRIEAYGGRVALCRLAIELIKGIARKVRMVDAVTREGRRGGEVGGGVGMGEEGGTNSRVVGYQLVSTDHAGDAYRCSIPCREEGCNLFSRMVRLILNGKRVTIMEDHQK
ncbi:MAG: hypothetical protein NZ888_00320 [Candidatus Nitrosocaldus sp.]|nr:hypothetical protein [Candidatus Nitrosocaldus sp.]MDW7999572.1 hypothetical protein [Candidatus Nitrosocaldus sp.]